MEDMLPFDGAQCDMTNRLFVGLQLSFNRIEKINMRGL